MSQVVALVRAYNFFVSIRAVDKHGLVGNVNGNRTISCKYRIKKNRRIRVGKIWQRHSSNACVVNVHDCCIIGSASNR
jgi:hypothetical protein